MPEFVRLFAESKGEPIIYKGRQLHLAHYFAVTKGDRIKVTRESTRSEWHQGIGLAVDGVFDVAGHQVRNEIILWEDVAPAELEIGVLPRTGRPRPATRRHPATGLLEVKNVWHLGSPSLIHYWHNGAAMIVEELPSGYRYRCNDGHPDEDFEDIVFRIEKLPKE